MSQASCRGSVCVSTRKCGCNLVFNSLTVSNLVRRPGSDKTWEVLPTKVGKQRKSPSGTRWNWRNESASAGGIPRAQTERSRGSTRIISTTFVALPNVDLPKANGWLSEDFLQLAFANAAKVSPEVQNRDTPWRFTTFSTPISLAHVDVSQNHIAAAPTMNVKAIPGALWDLLVSLLLLLSVC